MCCVAKTTVPFKYAVSPSFDNTMPVEFTAFANPLFLTVSTIEESNISPVDIIPPFIMI